ncbi:MAG: methyltransferase domain-containing protein [Anaerolineaceae bacterium]|nr:methyltransferase domain-containing protein [Anaerolineaceae bacterium]
MSQLDADLTRHYAFTDVETAVSAAMNTLDSAGAELALKDLAGLDQFHVGGLDASLKLAQLADFKAGDHVLDVGGGLGGTARLLAREYSCDVTVLDLMESYCRVGEMLTARTNLASHVHFEQGNALDMPFADQSFDAVWTQHSSMNIADKQGLYTQIHRVLRHGGTLVMHEVMAGTVQPVQFPVMWARDASMSFLIPPDALQTLLIQTGFQVQNWEDISEQSLTWLEARAANQQRTGANMNSLGLHLLLGSDLGTLLSNLLLNLREGRIRLIQTVLHRL